MATYTYRLNMGGAEETTIEGIKFIKATNINYTTDQLNLNKYVPSKLDKWVDGVLSNTDNIIPHEESAQEKRNTRDSIYSTDANGNVTGLVLPNGTTRYSPYILAQSCIPTILPSSGTFGTDGTITLATAIDHNLIVGALCNIIVTPEMAAASGLAQGVYEGTILTTTGSLTTGTTTALKITGVTTTGAAYTQGVRTTTHATVILPANCLGLNGAFRLNCIWTFSNSVNAKTPAVAFDGANILSKSRTTSNMEAWGLYTVRNRGSLAVQHSASPNNISDSVTSSTTGDQRLQVNTAIDKNITFLAGNGAATDYVILESYYVEVIPS